MSDQFAERPRVDTESDTLPSVEVAPSAPLVRADELVRALPVGQACILVLSGRPGGSLFLLDGDAVIGRHALSDIVLDDITVSRHHAELERTSEGYVISDLRSLNGTYVNGERADRAELESGDEIQVGRFRLLFLSPE